MKVSVVLPAYNEAPNIGAVIKRIGESFKESLHTVQIIVVDDGSIDETADVVRSLQMDWPVTLLQHPRNLGLGRALSTGITAAMKTPGAVVTMDADNSHDPRYIPLMVEQLGGECDIVIASRYRRGSRCEGVPFFRKVLSYGASFGLRLFVPYPNVRDYSTSFRVYSSSSLTAVVDHFGKNFIRERGFASSVELLLNLRGMGMRAVEIPYILRYDLERGKSKMKIFRTIWRYGIVVFSAPSAYPFAASRRSAKSHL